MKRHEAALGVQEGVCDLRVIARALAEAAEEAVKDGTGAERDPAVRVIAYRLAQLCKVDEVSCGYDPATLKDLFCTLMDECKARAQESAQEPPPVNRSIRTMLGRLTHRPGR